MRYRLKKNKILKKLFKIKMQNNRIKRKKNKKLKLKKKKKQKNIVMMIIQIQMKIKIIQLKNFYNEPIIQQKNKQKELKMINSIKKRKKIK